MLTKWKRYNSVIDEWYLEMTMTTHQQSSSFDSNVAKSWLVHTGRRHHLSTLPSPIQWEMHIDQRKTTKYSGKKWNTFGQKILCEHTIPLLKVKLIEKIQSFLSVSRSHHLSEYKSRWRPARASLGVMGGCLHDRMLTVGVALQSAGTRNWRHFGLFTLW